MSTSPRPQPAKTTAPQDQTGLARRLLTLHDAAMILGLSVASIRRLIASGDLPALRLTRRLLVDVQDVERLIETLKARGPWP